MDIYVIDISALKPRFIPVRVHVHKKYTAWFSGHQTFCMCCHVQAGFNAYCVVPT